MQMLYMYLIGRYISIYSDSPSRDSHRHIYCIVFLVSVFLWCLLTLINSKYSLFHWWGCSYHNPIVVVASVSFFLLFTTIHFQSKVVNYLAASAISIYLIHCHPLVHAHLFTTVTNSILQTSLSKIPVISLLLWSLLVMIICIGIDQIRRLILPHILRYIKV